MTLLRKLILAIIFSENCPLEKILGSCEQSPPPRIVLEGVVCGLHLVILLFCKFNDANFDATDKIHMGQILIGPCVVEDVKF